jgi:hypothetical protein
MDTNREGVTGAILGAMIGAALPGLSKFVLWVLAVILVALLHRHFEHALESRMGTVATIVTALLVGPLFTVLKGTMQSVFAFFYFFVTVAAGYVLGSMFAAKGDENEDL